MTSGRTENMTIERIKNIIQVSEEIGSDIAKIVAYDKIKEIINEQGFWGMDEKQETQEINESDEIGK